MRLDCPIHCYGEVNQALLSRLKGWQMENCIIHGPARYGDGNSFQARIEMYWNGLKVTNTCFPFFNDPQ